jgi:hypothetical protein
MNTVAKPVANGAARHLSPVDMLFSCLVIMFVLFSYTASRQESATNDEFRHLSTGVYYWQAGDYTFDNATPPLWKMAMSLPAHVAGAKPVRFREVSDTFKGSEPWLVATDFMRDNAAAYDDYLQSARLVNILAAAGGLVLLYIRCRGSFGPGAALFGTAFLAFSPTFLAHSHYATTDIIATLTLMAVVFLLIDYLHKPGPARLFCVALVFAFGLLCKFSALLLAPLLLILPLLVALRTKDGDAGRRQRLPAVVLSLAKSLVLVVVTVLLTVNIFYGFKGTGTSLGQMRLESRTLATLGQTRFGHLPIPLPKAFVAGFDRQKADSDYSEFPAYFMGKWSLDGFRIYYLAAFSLKESVPFLLLCAGSLFTLLRPRGLSIGRAEMLLFLYVPLTLILVLSCLNRLNVGVRYLLPAYPFLCLFIAGFYRSCREWRGARLAFLLTFVLHSASVFRVSPHYTSYFNELSGGSANGYRHLIDSNIDWGQDLPSLKKFMTDHGIGKVQLAYFGHGLPEFYGVAYEPLSLPAKPGYAAISVSLLQGHPYLLTYLSPPQIAEFGQFRAISNLQPVGRAGYSMMIYKID